MSPHNGAMKRVRTVNERVCRAACVQREEALRYIELYEEFCLSQDRSKRKGRGENATENNEKL